MKKKWNIWHIIGFHTYSNSIEVGDYGLGGETKIVYSSPWALFGTKYNHYKCLDCGRKFWMTMVDFQEIQIHEKLVDLLIKENKNNE